MIALAALIYLPPRGLAASSVAIIALHNLLDLLRDTTFGRAAWLWDILHQQNVFSLLGMRFAIAYPVLPWIGVMAGGYCLGQVFLWEPSRRQRFLFRLGFAMSAAFVLVRFVNVYGDPSPWQHQPTSVFTLLSFLNTTKYPPSLDFVLMTLGPALIALAWLDRRTFCAENPLLVFGRVPVFLLRVAPRARAPHRHHHELRALWTGAVSAACSPFHGNSGKTLPARLWLSSMGRVRSVDRSARVTVSGVFVVRPPQAAPRRLVAKLLVNGDLGNARLALYQQYLCPERSIGERNSSAFAAPLSPLINSYVCSCPSGPS
jgi:hypothetical protein